MLTESELQQIRDRAEKNEIWADIKGYEGVYMVSNIGRIKSLSRVVIRNGDRKYTVVERIRKLRKNKKGYMDIVFHQIKKFSVHRLVAIAFIHNPNNLPEVNHKNKDKSDNRAENLEWCTHLENMNHFNKNTNYNHLPVGSKHKRSKLTEEQVLEIRKLESDGFSRKQLQKQFNISAAMIGYIITRKYWKHI